MVLKNSEWRKGFIYPTPNKGFIVVVGLLLMHAHTYASQFPSNHCSFVLA